MQNKEKYERVLAWADVLDDANYYELLGILELADEGAIRHAFHLFSEAFHPDQHRNASDELRDLTTTIYKRGVEAYHVLRDEKLRAEYDLALAKGHLRLGVAARTGQGTARSLDDLCNTPAGKLHARRADQHISDGRLADAYDALALALDVEGRNPALKERLDAIKALRAAGGG